jgi:hypothetical protein
MLPFSGWYEGHRKHRRKIPRLYHEEVGISEKPSLVSECDREYSYSRLLVRCMRPCAELEASTHTDTPTPQLRKKRNKHMKGQFIVASSLVLTLPAGLILD